MRCAGVKHAWGRYEYENEIIGCVKWRGFSCVAERLLASQEILYSMVVSERQNVTTRCQQLYHINFISNIFFFPPEGLSPRRGGRA
jgi:hypothetical protein